MDGSHHIHIRPAPCAAGQQEVKEKNNSNAGKERVLRPQERIRIGIGYWYVGLESWLQRIRSLLTSWPSSAITYNLTWVGCAGHAIYLEIY